MSALLVAELLGPDFRPTWATCAKLPGTYRIVIVGDSYVFGFGVPQDAAMPAELERSLDDGRAPAIEVLNLGRPGLNLQVEAVWIDEIAAQVEYDLLVLCVATDDAHPWRKGEIARRLESWERSWAEQWSPDGESAALMLHTLAELVQLHRDSGRQLALVFYEPCGSSRAARAVLSELAVLVDVPFLDLVEPFARFNVSALRVSPADDHPSPLAHKIAARELRAWLSDRLPRPQGLDAGLAERAGALAELDEHLPPGCALPHRFLVPRAARLSREARVLLAEWGQQLDNACRAAAALEAARRDPPAMLQDAITSAAHQLRLAERRAAGAVGPCTGEALLLRLAATARETRELLTGVPVEPIAPSEDGASQTRDPMADWLAARIPAAAARLLGLIDARATQERRLLVACGRTLALGACSAAVSLPDATIETLRRLEILWLRQRELAALASPAHGDDVRLVAEMSIPANHGFKNVCIECAYETVFPYPALVRQAHYVVGDGRVRGYEFDLPIGTAGCASVAASGVVQWTEGLVPLDDCAPQLWIRRGTERAAYHSGDVIHIGFGSTKCA